MAIIQRVGKKVLDRDKSKDDFVGCSQINQRGSAMLKSLFPPRGAKAPPITRLQS
jgi:hypothetical protein